MSELIPHNTMSNEVAAQWLSQRILGEEKVYTVEFREAVELAVNALYLAQSASEPLTLEQLREMDGEPVYCVYPGCSTGGEWFLVDSQGAYKNGSFLNFRYYGEWLAYRRKAERSENDAL